MSIDVRDAAAWRRWARRLGITWLGAQPPGYVVRETRRTRALFGADYPARIYGLPAYVPDPPLPLP